MKPTMVRCSLALFLAAVVVHAAQIPQPQNAAAKASIQGIVMNAGTGQILNNMPMENARCRRRRTVRQTISANTACSGFQLENTSSV